jgi:RNA polymerase sigma-70 factor (ECF subfamily)
VADTAETVSREREKGLIDRARAGDVSTLRELVDLHKDRLFGFIWRMVRRHHDAEDICQEAFLKAFASLDSFSSQYRFSTWLFTIAYRICLNQMRRKRPVTGELDLSALPHESLDVPGASLESEEAGHVKALVWSAVDRLSPPQRATVLLFYRYEVNCQEIARVLGLPVATVKSHLHRARNRLREMLESVTERDLQEFRNRAGSAG